MKKQAASEPTDAVTTPGAGATPNATPKKRRATPASKTSTPSKKAKMQPTVEEEEDVEDPKIRVLKDIQGDLKKAGLKKGAAKNKGV